MMMRGVVAGSCDGVGPSRATCYFDDERCCCRQL